MRSSMMTGMLALSLVALPAYAQKAPAGATVTASEPGKAAMANAVRASAVITAIDKASRTITLKGESGKTFDLVAGDQVKNFDQLTVGDIVRVEYARALSMELKKGGGPLDRKETAETARAKPGEKPAGATGRKITVMTEVIDVNAQNKTITLKGPKGNVVELDVKNPEHFKVVKTGDRVEVVYVEAEAFAVVPAPKPGAKK